MIIFIIITTAKVHFCSFLAHYSLSLQLFSIVQLFLCLNVWSGCKNGMITSLRKFLFCFSFSWLTATTLKSVYLIDMAVSFTRSLTDLSLCMQESQIRRIYSTMINQKLEGFKEDVKPIGEILTQATLKLYYAVSAHFLPTPAKIHYLFNLRDISKVHNDTWRGVRSTQVYPQHTRIYSTSNMFSRKYGITTITG